MEEMMALLRDGHFHSGEELGKALGVTRAAVWKKVQAMTTLGLELDAVRGKGYRLPSRVDLLDRDHITKYWSADAQKIVVLTLKHSTSSTNDAVREGAVDEGKPIQICVAEHQSAGRGRRGRVWVSPFGASLYYSMLCRSEGGFAAMEGLSLAVGLTILKTLELMGVSGLSLKWPNDLVAVDKKGGYKKLAGVLLEVSGDPTGTCEIVIGIGINLVLSQEQKKQIDQPATDVRSVLGRRINKNELVGRLTTELIAMLEIFWRDGFQAFRRHWEKYDAFIGQDVVLLAGDRRITGIATGVNESGAVLIKDDMGITAAYAGGEISLRKL